MWQVDTKYLFCFFNNHCYPISGLPLLNAVLFVFLPDASGSFISTLFCQQFDASLDSVASQEIPIKLPTFWQYLHQNPFWIPQTVNIMYCINLFTWILLQRRYIYEILNKDTESMVVNVVVTRTVGTVYILNSREHRSVWRQLGA